jgi:enoyl-CoA hydratase/carnithine racemase
MDQVRTELQANVLQIVIDRPDKKNALTAPMYVALTQAFEQAERNREVRVIVLRGTGDSFSAGNDIEDFLQKPWKNDSIPPQERFMRAVANATRPVIAAVQGSAVGIGTTILLHCDLVYAADNAKFLMPFVSLGIVPEAGSTLLLPLLVGHRVAAELLLLATPFSAQRAHELGLVNHVVPVTELLTAVHTAAQQLAAKPTAAVRMSKELLKGHFRDDLDRVIRAEMQAVAQRLGSPETAEALNAFLEKRKPDFSKFN